MWTVEDFERLVDKLETKASVLLLVHRGPATIFSRSSRSEAVFFRQ